MLSYGEDADYRMAVLAMPFPRLEECLALPHYCYGVVSLQLTMPPAHDGHDGMLPL